MNKYQVEIRRKFPRWSKIRQDDSSTGAMLFSSIGKELESIRFSNELLKTQQHILENEQLLEVSNYYEAAFNSDQLNAISETSTIVTPKCSADGQTLTLLNSIDEYYSKAVDRIAQVGGEATIQVELDYSNGSVLLVEPSYVYIKLEDLIFKTEEYNFSNSPYIKIRGYDFTGEPREETFLVNDSGLFKSKFKYRKLETLDVSDEVTSGPMLEYFGFEGDIKLLTRPIGLTEHKLDYHLAGTKEDKLNFGNSTVYNNLIISLRNEADISYIDYMIKGYENAQDYKTALSNIEEEDVYYILFSQVLKASGANIKAKSLVYSKLYDRILVLDEAGSIHFYKVEETSFKRKRINRTATVDFNFYSDYQRVALGETLDIDVHLQRGRGYIYKVFFVRHTPGSTDVFPEFLKEENGELVWSSDFYLFDGKSVADKYLNMQSFRFENEFTEPGQYDFFSFSFQNDTKTQAISQFDSGEIEADDFLKLIELELEDKTQQSIFINDYSVMCESQSAEKSFELSINNSCELSIIGIDNLLSCVRKDGNNYRETLYRFIKDCFLFERARRIVVFENYSSLDFLLGGLNYTFNDLTRKASNTSLDEIALKHAIVRTKEESIADFKDRVLMLLSKHKYNEIEESFKYITELKPVDIGEIPYQEGIDYIEITSEYFIFKKLNANEVKKPLSELKFIKDFLEYLDANGISYTRYENDNDYLDCRNLQTQKFNKVNPEFFIAGESSALPHKYIKANSIQIHNEEESVSRSEITKLSEVNDYYLEENVVYFTRGEAGRSIRYDYYNWPIKLTWLPMKMIEAVSDDFDFLTKEKSILTQGGARLYNQILKRQNTYWGK